MLKKDFIDTIYHRHSITVAIPPTHEIAAWTDKVLQLMFPEQAKVCFHSVSQIHLAFEKIELELRGILLSMQSMMDGSPVDLAENFINQIPEIYRLLNTDVSAIMAGDPAAQSEYEIIRSYPGFYAIAFYRIAHVVHKLGIPLLPRILTEYAHSKTGTDIHPAAQIDEYFYIDHATGIVIGSTSIIGKNVKLYQGVTLGALSVSKDMANTKRHPTVQDNVVIYANATILGGETTVGHHSVIGGNVWLTKSIPPNSTIYHKAELKVIEGEV